MSEKRKNELKKLKKKFGFKISGENNALVTNNEYKDRAEIRRKTVGSHNDGFKTEVACVTQYVITRYKLPINEFPSFVLFLFRPIKKTNKGFKMLAKMGWSEGKPLGAKSEEAITEPVSTRRLAAIRRSTKENHKLPKSRISLLVFYVARRHYL